MPGPANMLFVVNPKAGPKNKALLVSLLNEELDPVGFNYQLEYTQAPGHARVLVQKAKRDKIPLVVVVGGDGTVNECASGLVNTEITLGIIPMGSGNGLARDLGIPVDTRKALRCLRGGNSLKIDCGSVNGSYFFCTAGVGFDAYISEKFSHNKQRGFAGYLRNTVQEFLSYQSQDYQITIDGKNITQKAFSLTFANASQFGNNAYISPLADIRDGKLDFCMVKDYPKHLGLELGLRLFNRSIHKSRYVEIIKMENALVNCPPGSFFHLDGEVVPLNGNTMNITILPQALTVRIPERTGDRSR